MSEWVLGVAAFVIGGSIGSFLAVVADRLPDGGNILSERSHCSVCHSVLGPIDMVPVLSYLALRGKCRTCQASIPLHLWFVELITGLLFLWIAVRGGAATGMAAMAVASTFFVLIALIDYQRGLIFNAMLLPAVVVALAMSPFWNEVGESRVFLETPEFLGSFLNSLVAGIGAFLMFLIALIMYPKGMGGGDVKYVALIGLITGFPGILIALWSAIVIGGLLSAALLALKIRDRKDAIPFGPFLSIGAIVGLLATDEIVSWYSGVFGI